MIKYLAISLAAHVLGVVAVDAIFFRGARTEVQRPAFRAGEAAASAEVRVRVSRDDGDETWRMYTHLPSSEPVEPRSVEFAPAAPLPIEAATPATPVTLAPTVTVPAPTASIAAIPAAAATSSAPSLPATLAMPAPPPIEATAEMPVPAADAAAPSMPTRAARGGVDHGVRISTLPAPRYPTLSRRHGEEGLVVLDVLVGSDGRVQRVRVIEDPGFPRLRRAAIEAVQAATFEPARRGGRPVEAAIEVPIRFDLR